MEIYGLFVGLCLIVYFLFRKSRKLILFVLLLFTMYLVLPIFFKSLRFNLITGGENLPSGCPTKEESIKRGVYVCDIQLPYSPYEINDSLKLVIKGGWIEESWYGGYWYWTTIKDDYPHYSISIETDQFVNSDCDWVIRNNRTNSYGIEKLGFHEGWFGGVIKRLPKSDTLRYNILKKENMDFSPENILGHLEFVLVK